MPKSSTVLRVNSQLAQLVCTNQPLCLLQCLGVLAASRHIPATERQ